MSTAAENGAALADDGGFLVTQNGGIDVTGYGIIAEPIPYREATPGLQRVHPEGTVSYLLDDGFHTAEQPRGRPRRHGVLHRAPGHYPPPDPPMGRVLAYHADGTLDVIARDFSFCNGITITPTGELVVVGTPG